jgi:hypothetical protein
VSHKPSQAWGLEVYLPKPKLFLLAHTISSLARATRLVYQASPDKLLPNHRITPGFPFQTSYTMTGEKANKERYGFIIYRCDYSDDAQWERFMAYLKNQTRRGMESENSLELYDRMDWKVIVKSLRNNSHNALLYMLIILLPIVVTRYARRRARGNLRVRPSNLTVSKCHSADLCRRFDKWLESGEEEVDTENYRYRACVLVNQACLDCLDDFMKDRSLETDDILTLHDHMGFTFIILVSRYKDYGGDIVPNAKGG